MIMKWEESDQTKKKDKIIKWQIEQRTKNTDVIAPIQSDYI